MMECLADLLAAHEDYSLYDSLKRLESIETVNPNFEHTLKGNAETWYCRSFICELIKGCCVPELKAIEKSLTEKIDADDRSFSGKPEYLNGERKKIQDAYYDTPLAELAPNHAEARLHLNDTLRKMADIAGFLTR